MAYQPVWGCFMPGGQKIVRLYLYRFLRVVLRTIIWYQVFLSNTNNLHTVVRFQVFFDLVQFLYLMAHLPLFNAKALLLEEQQWYYLTHSWEDKGVQTFPKSICPKLNVIARLEYELTYYDSAVHRFNHYTTRTPKHSYLIQITCTQQYGFKYSYLIKITRTQQYGFKYSYLIQVTCTQWYNFKYSYLIKQFSQVRNGLAEPLLQQVYKWFELRFFSFSEIGCHNMVNEPSQIYYLLIARGRIGRFIPFPRFLVLTYLVMWLHLAPNYKVNIYLHLATKSSFIIRQITKIRNTYLIIYLVLSTFQQHKVISLGYFSTLFSTFRRCIQAV